ncbi:MAG: phosphatidylserine decarboxylase [Magnetococcales bacterium]|nr:phosphatidylserine decarboxylase [Magnetococcales bacterium]
MVTVLRRLTGLGGILLAGAGLLLWTAHVTDFLHGGLVKDPERATPAGPVIVAPADGTVLYVRRVEAGAIAEVVKKGVRVALTDYLKRPLTTPDFRGWLIGIFMKTHGVHINRIPLAGEVRRITVHNGPHLSMKQAEKHLLYAEMIPGLIALRKWLGHPPFDISDEEEFVLKSARETLEIRDERDRQLFVIRIADYYVGRILTWVEEGRQVASGERFGMITWGSQTDLLIEESPGLQVTVQSGDRVLGGESVLASF